MNSFSLHKCDRLAVSPYPPYDPFQAFVRDNHIAIKGTNQGLLKGLVFAVKDVFMVKGSTYSNGHPLWLQTHAPDSFTSSYIVKLLNCGADLVGKTVCDELCYSISGENWHYGSPLNPWDARRYTGGSSSGSGAATAAGLVDFATGSDCLGSVRTPASFTGLFGMRPTYTRIPNDGEAPYCKSMDVLGYMARSVEVFETLSSVLLGNDTEAEDCVFKNSIVAKDCFDSLDHMTRASLEPVVDFITDYSGSSEVLQVAEEGLERWVKTFQAVQGFEVWESYGEWIEKYKPVLSPGPKMRLEWARTLTREDYYEALKDKERILHYFEEFLRKDTVLILPTVSSIAPLRTASQQVINFNRAVSSKFLCISPLAGVPQVTIPLATQDSMPLGISLISSRNTDLKLVRLACRLFRDFSLENNTSLFI